MEMILTKQEVASALENLNRALRGQSASLIRTVRNYGVNGILATVYTVSSQAIGSAVAAILLDYANDVSNDKKWDHLDAYTDWLNRMNALNYQAVKVNLYNYQDVAAGVKFTRDVPNVIGYQESNGNWVLPY